MPGTFELKPAAGGKFMFNLKAANNEIILTSELYNSKDAAENGIESVRTNAPVDQRYERRESTRGEPYFVLTATNGQTIGQSEMYSSENARDNGILSVKANAPTATIDEAD